MVSTHWRAYLQYQEAVQERIRQREELSPNSNVPRPTLAQVLLPPGIIFEATRPEDKIHALYGICRLLGFDLPAPDYTKPLATVYTEAAQAILRYDGQNGLDSLLRSACGSQSGWDKGIPSWVPNLAGCLRKWTPSSPPHMFLDDRNNISPSGCDYAGCHLELGVNPVKLCVKGRRLDVICEASRPWVLDNSTNMFGRAPMPTGNHILSLVDSLESWFGIAMRSLGEVFPDQTPAAAQRLAEALARDTMRTPSAEILQDHARHLSVAITVSRSNHDPGCLVLADPQEGPQEYVLYGDCFLSTEMYSAFGRIHTMGWKTVFWTAQGFIGAGSHTVQDGDIVTVFHGCSMAAVVRPWGDVFRYIGPAYISGIMHGEFWATGSAADDEFFELI